MRTVFLKSFHIFLALVLAAFLIAPVKAAVTQSAEPGSTVRNAFGPQTGHRANQCRGACGGGCPSSCETSVMYECAAGQQLRRVLVYDCGTHRGCRVHDDCLDACSSAGQDAASCSSQCDSEIINRFGFDKAGAWLLGKGPYDGRTRFEYTLDAPNALEPAYRCPLGSKRQCGVNAGCKAQRAWVEPVFDSYPDAGPGTMRILAFRAGPACGERVCEQSAEIRVTGTETCPEGACTRYGMEFDYQNADPSAPLECKPSTSGGGSDFVGTLLKQGADAMQSRGAASNPKEISSNEDGMQALMGLFSAVISSADSPEDVNISIAPLDADGKPIESQRTGSVPSIPRSIELPSRSGHLFVPMYQLADGVKPNQPKERRIRCTHKGQPVLDTTFRLVSDS